MKTILSFLGAFYVVSMVAGSAIDKIKSNIKFQTSKVRAFFNPTNGNLVKVKALIFLENNNLFPIDFEDFKGSIWYGDIVFNEQGQPTNQAGIKISDVLLSDFQQIAPNSIGSIILEFDMDIGQIITNTGNVVANGGIAITTIIKLYGEIGLVSTSYTGKIVYPVIVPINLLEAI